MKHVVTKDTWSFFKLCSSQNSCLKAIEYFKISLSESFAQTIDSKAVFVVHFLNDHGTGRS